MFNWFWRFLYGISRSLFRIIDGLAACANKLCGIESIYINGTETDFLTYIIKSDVIANGFRIAVVAGLIVLVFFTIARIIFVITKEKPDVTPGQVCIKAFKTVLLFLFVPAIMITSIWIMSVLMNALYKATMNGAPTLGTFLFSAFSQDCEVYNQIGLDEILSGAHSYSDTYFVSDVIDVSDFDFIFSWIASLAIIVFLAKAMITFVDRAITIAILFIVSPFSLASSVLDDGVRAKLWREQVLVKFISAFGIILYINVYCLVVSLVVPKNVVFFDNSFVNNLFKVVVILGGAFAIQKSVSILGNLVSAGAGSREMMDTSLADYGGRFMKWGLGKAGGAIWNKITGRNSAGKAQPAAAGESARVSNNNNQGEPFTGSPNYGGNKNGNDIKEAIQNSSNNGNNNSNSSGNNVSPTVVHDNKSGSNSTGAANNNISNKDSLNQRRGDLIRNSLNNNNNNNNNGNADKKE